jgi:hypothetical protein
MYKILIQRREKISRLEDLGMYRKKTLKLIVNKIAYVTTRFIWLRIWTIGQFLWNFRFCTRYGIYWITRWLSISQRFCSMELVIDIGITSSIEPTKQWVLYVQEDFLNLARGNYPDGRRSSSDTEQNTLKKVKVIRLAVQAGTAMWISRQPPPSPLLVLA